MLSTLKKSSLAILVASTALFQIGCKKSTDADLVGNWYKTSLPSFGGAARSGAVSFVIGDKGYIGTGYTNETIPRTKDFWSYNSSARIWSQVAEFAGTARNDAAAFVIGSKAYVGTGYDGVITAENGYKKDFWSYDPAANKWTAIADFPGTRQYSSAFTVGDKGYVGLGWNGTNFYQDFYEYNATTNAWKEIATFLGGKRRGAYAFTAGGKGYVGFGTNNSYAATRDMYQFDPAGNGGLGGWIAKNKMTDDDSNIKYPTARAHGIAMVVGEKVYLVGGTSNSETWEYTPTADTWLQKTSFEGGTRANAAGFVLGNVVYIGTGANGSNRTDDFWGFDPNVAVDTDDNN